VPGSFQRAESLHDRRDQCSFAVANPRSVGSTNRSLNCVTHTAAVIRLITRQFAFSLEAVVIFRRSGRPNRSEFSGFHDTIRPIDRRGPINFRELHGFRREHDDVACQWQLRRSGNLTFRISQGVENSSIRKAFQEKGGPWTWKVDASYRYHTSTTF
jgi:hypothetical protein